MMKKAIQRSILMLLACNTVKAVTLSLTDSSTLPLVSSFPQGDHYDLYRFPRELLTVTPITNLRVQYSDDALPGEHLILETFILFDPTLVFSVVETLNTQEVYDATITFSVPITSVSGSYFDTAFAALHSDHSGSNTALVWTATYLGGSQAMAFDGIVPEPSVFIMAVLGAMLGLGRRARSVD